MIYTAKNFSHLTSLGKITQESMILHLKLYEGYVNNLNKILEKINNLSKEGIGDSLQEWNELHRRLGWEYNGMRLHEIFFGAISVEETNIQILEGTELGQKIINTWGSLDKWREDFYNVAKIRGFGWTMLVEDTQTGDIFNTWVNEHDVGILANGKIHLCVDMLEHAYIRDFGTDRAAYLDTIFNHIDWEKLHG